MGKTSQSIVNILRVVAWAEGISFLLILFVSMPLKYIWDMPELSGSSSVGRASAFQAEGRGFESRLPLCRILFNFTYRPGAFWNYRTNCLCSSVVEHFLGKEEVAGSIPFIGSITTKKMIYC
jgi:hypothetical protein